MQDSEDLVSTLQAMLWSSPTARRELQEHGINLVPANFYSSVPSIAEIEQSFEYAEPAPYLDNGLFDGVHLAAVLDELNEYASELEGPMEDDHDAPSGFFWNNGQFGYSDAAAYYAFIRSRKPRRILEIGSGFSTLIANAAISANGCGEIICIEPFPRPFLTALQHVSAIVTKPAQAIAPAWVNDLLGDGDMLFIDSTHTVKIGSDCLHLYLRLLPALRHHLLIHVHDVFLPEGMPAHWAAEKHIYWTEQYLLLAYLLDNPRVRVMFGSNYLRMNHPEALARMTPPEIPIGGSSFWFERFPLVTDAPGCLGMDLPALIAKFVRRFHRPNQDSRKTN